jgi:osmotically-inducible protein OsmY
VQNGVVSLYGTVDNEGDKNIAYIQASSVPNVFKVNNYLQVAGEKGKK